MPTSVSAAGYAHCAGTPASASVRVPLVSVGTVAVRCKHDPVRSDFQSVLVDERAEQRVVPEAAPEAGRADDLRLAVNGQRDPETALAPGVRQRLVPRPGPADTRAHEAA